MIYKGKTLLSNVDPVRRCERAADAVSLRERTLYFCPSPLYGYGLKKLASRIEKEAPGSAILCAEAEPALCEIFQNNFIPCEDTIKKIFFFNISSDSKNTKERICAFINEVWGTRAFRRIETVKLTGGWQLHLDLYNSLEDVLRQEIATNWANALTLAKLGRLYIKNFLKNLNLIYKHPSIGELSFSASPVLVLGAGPSLDDTLDTLQKRFPDLSTEKRNFKIVCADTCLGSLLERNIIPDLAVILESQHWNLRDFTGFNGRNINFAFDLSALPQSAHILGSGFLFFTSWTQLKIFERLKEAGLLPAVLPPLGSVGLTAVEIAKRVTKGNIICAGLDFSFSIDKFHARGTPSHKSRLNNHNRLTTLISNAAFKGASFTALSKSGLPVLSNPGLRNYRDLFEREFANVLSTSPQGEVSRAPRLFTICDNGLPLGIKTLSMNEAMDMLCDASSQTERQSSNNAEIYNEEKKVILKEKLLTLIKKELERLNEIKSMLSGESEIDEKKLNSLISEYDYLFAHFPDYAGNQSRIEIEYIKNQSFLNRLRTELEPMVKLLNWNVENVHAEAQRKNKMRRNGLFFYQYLC